MSSPRKPFHEIALESFGLLTQNFVLTYPLLLFFLLVSVIMPTTYQPNLQEARWWVLGVGIFLIHCLVMAGSFNMIATGVRLHYERLAKPIPENPESLDDIEIPNPLEDFVALLREFFPGVSRHFVQFVFGSLVQMLVLIAIYLWFAQALEGIGGLPETYRELSQQAVAGEDQPPIDAQALLASLSPEEREHHTRFAGLLLAGIGLYAVFYFISIFWQAFVVIQDKPFWGAYWASLVQCLRRPVVIIGIAMLYTGLVLSLALLPPLGGTLFAALAQFLSILIHVYFAVVTVMVVADGSTAVPAAEKAQPEKQMDHIG